MSLYILTPSKPMPRLVPDYLTSWQRFIVTAYSLLMAGYIALIIAIILNA